MSQSDFDKQAERENLEKELLIAIKGIENNLHMITQWCQADLELRGCNVVHKPRRES